METCDVRVEINHSNAPLETRQHQEPANIRFSSYHVGSNYRKEGLVLTLTLVDTERCKTWKVLKAKSSNSDNQQHGYFEPWLLLLKNGVM